MISREKNTPAFYQRRENVAAYRKNWENNFKLVTSFPYTIDEIPLVSSDLDPSAEPKLAHPYNIKVFHSELARTHDLPRLSGYITYPQPSRPYQTPLNARFKSLHQLAATKNTRHWMKVNLKFIPFIIILIKKHVF